MAWILRVLGRAQMSATPPKARIEYSTRLVLPLILAGALLGALLLIVAEFTTLFTVQVATSPGPIKTQTTGAHNFYALVPIALLAMVMAWGLFRYGSRPALLAIGLLGFVTLLIALVGDLPDAHATGLVGNAATHYINASSTPGVGLYLETLGAVLLLISCVVGFMLLGPPSGPRAPGRSRANAGGTSRERVSAS